MSLEEKQSSLSERIVKIEDSALSLSLLLMFDCRWMIHTKHERQVVEEI